jgi:hypothetical protein
MPTVPASPSSPTLRTRAVPIGRKKHRGYLCSGCGNRNNCVCLSELRILAATMPLVKELLVGTTDLPRRRQLRAQLTDLAARYDQSQREIAAIWGGRGALVEPERDLLEDLVTDWGYEPGWLRSVEAVADRRKVPVAHVRAVLDRFFRDSRPRAARAGTASASRRAA